MKPWGEVMTDILKSLVKDDLDAVAPERDRLAGFRDERVPNRLAAESAHALRLEDAYCRDYYPERRR